MSAGIFSQGCRFVKVRAETELTNCHYDVLFCHRMNSTSTVKKRPPFTVFLAATIVIFALTLSAADSIGLVPCQIDNTCDQASVSVADLPQLGVEGSADTNA